MSKLILPSRKLWTPPQRQRGYVVLDGYRGGGGGGDLTAGLLHWWALEESSGTRSDSHSAISLSPIGTVTNTGGVVGSGSNAAPGARLYSSSSTSLASGDFTISGLFKTSASDYGIASRQGPTGLGIPSRQWLVTIEGGVLYLALSVDGFVNVAHVGTGSGLNNNNFHDFFAWRDTAADKIWLQLDGGAPVSAYMLGTTALFSGTDYGFTLHGVGGGIYVNGGVNDEIAIWSRALTSDERVWIRNGGAWRAYADLDDYSP